MSGQRGLPLSVGRWLSPAAVQLALAVALLPSIAGCRFRIRIGTPRMAVELPSATTPPADGPEMTAPGSWTALPEGFEPSHLACGADFCIVGGLVGLEPVLYRFAPPSTLERFHAVPVPANHESAWTSGEIGPVEPWISIDERDGRQQFSVTRVEYQGGSFGVVVYPQLGSPQHEVLASPTDSDISFGVPHILRGDELFTLEPGLTGGSVWHYTRDDAIWSGAAIALPRGDETELSWELELSDDANALYLMTHDVGFRVERFERNRRGQFEHAGYFEAPAPAQMVGQIGDELVLVFHTPQPGDQSVWLVAAETGRPLQRLRVPPDTNGTVAQTVVASEFGVLVTQLADVWLLSAVRADLPCRLTLLPRPDDRSTWPQGALMGSRAVVIDRGQLGVFEANDCR